MSASLLGPRLTQVGSWVQVPAGPLSWSDFDFPSPHPPEDSSSPGGQVQEKVWATWYVLGSLGHGQPPFLLD